MSTEQNTMKNSKNRLICGSVNFIPSKYPLLLSKMTYRRVHMVFVSHSKYAFYLITNAHVDLQYSMQTSDAKYINMECPVLTNNAL